MGEVSPRTQLYLLYIAIMIVVVYVARPIGILLYERVKRKRCYNE